MLYAYVIHVLPSPKSQFGWCRCSGRETRLSDDAKAHRATSSCWLNLKTKGIPNERTWAPPQNLLITIAGCLQMPRAHKGDRWAEPLQYTGTRKAWITDRRISHFVDAQRQHFSANASWNILAFTSRCLSHFALYKSNSLLAHKHVFVAKVSSSC